MGKHSVQNQRKRSLALRKIYKKKFPHTRFALDKKSVHKIVTTQIRSGILEEIWSDIPDLTNIVEVEMEEEGSDQENDSESESEEESSSEEEEESSNIETSKEGTSSQDNCEKGRINDESCEEGRGDEGVSNNDQDNLNPIAKLLVSSENEAVANEAIVNEAVANEAIVDEAVDDEAVVDEVVADDQNEIENSDDEGDGSISPATSYSNGMHTSGDEDSDIADLDELLVDSGTENNGEIDRDSEDEEEEYTLQHYRPVTPTLTYEPRPVGVVAPFNVSAFDSPASPDFDYSAHPQPLTPGTSHNVPNAESANVNVSNAESANDEYEVIDLSSDDDE